MKGTLNARRERFVEEYLIDLNATQAAIRAGYSARSAGARGAELLNQPAVSACLAERMQERSRRTGISQDRVLHELAVIAFGDKRSLMQWGPEGVTLRDSTELSDDAAAMVAEVLATRTSTGGSLKLKTHDKVRALELLGRHLGMFRNDAMVIDSATPVAQTLHLYLPDNRRDGEPQP